MYSPLHSSQVRRKLDRPRMLQSELVASAVADWVARPIAGWVEVTRWVVGADARRVVAAVRVAIAAVRVAVAPIDSAVCNRRGRGQDNRRRRRRGHDDRRRWWGHDDGRRGHNYDVTPPAPAPATAT